MKSIRDSILTGLRSINSRIPKWAADFMWVIQKCACITTWVRLREWWWQEQYKIPRKKKKKNIFPPKVRRNYTCICRIRVDLFVASALNIIVFIFYFSRSESAKCCKILFIYFSIQVIMACTVAVYDLQIINNSKSFDYCWALSPQLVRHTQILLLRQSARSSPATQKLRTPLLLLEPVQ